MDDSTRNPPRRRPAPAWLLLCAVVLATMPALAADYAQTAGSTLAFSGSLQGERFQGRFPGFATRLHFDPAKPALARLDVVIPLASATTGNRDHDAEMRGEALLDVRRFAQARYTARGFRALGGDRYAADGMLHLHGVARPVTLAFTWTAGKQPSLSGTATVRRLQFGIGSKDWGDAGTLSDAIDIDTRVVFAPVATKR
jgi:polyisoprenoid-binding protein YceI